MSDPLLVPMHLDAMVLNKEASDATPFLRFEPDYSLLRKLEPVGPAPFAGGSPTPPSAGIYLHWTLPRPLRHATQAENGTAEFPLVPNRWVVVRIQAGVDPAKAVKAWVLESDFLHDDFEGGSAYVDPHTLDDDGMPMPTRVGRARRLDGTLSVLNDTKRPFLRAIGPGSATFAIYAPAVNDVFAFWDDATDVDGASLAGGSFTYHVTGWYSDPTFDPLQKATWAPESGDASVDDALGFVAFLGSTPGPTSMLVHALVSGVPWDRDADSPPAPNYPSDVQSKVRVAVGNTAVDALSALVHLESGNQAEADLLEAFQYGLLDDLDQPGAAERLDNAIRRHWYGASPGGLRWRVVAAARSHGSTTPAPPPLNPNQQAALATLNRAQRESDRQARVLEAMRARLYSLWWKASWLMAHPATPPFKHVPWLRTQLAVQLGTEHPAAGGTTPYVQRVATQASALAAAETAVEHAHTALLALLDPAFVLESGSLPEYHAPNDPVVLVTGLGRSANLDPVEDLTCRLPSQTVDALSVDGSTGVAPPLHDPSGLLPAAVQQLHAESLFLSPALFAQDVLKNPGKIGDVRAVIAALPPPGPTVRFAPATGSAVEWVQPWVPVLLDWEITMLRAPAYQAGTGPHAPVWTLDGANWRFDGTDHTWVGHTKAQGDDFNGANSKQMTLRGRTFLTPHLNFTLADQLDQWVRKHSVSDPKVEALLKDLDGYLDGIRGQDILSQRLSGLRTMLLQRDGTATVPPTGKIAEVLGPQPQRGFPVPFPEPVPLPVWDFAPMAGAFFTLDRLTVIDFMGRAVDLTLANWSQNPQTGDSSGDWFYPIAATDLRAPTELDPSPSRGKVADATQRMLQLRPRLSQDAQLALRLTTNDGSNEEVDPAAGAMAVCGWLVPNHLDRSIAVYEPDGTACGELFGSRHADHSVVPLWQPDPTNPGAPQSIGAIKNQYVREMLQALIARTDRGDAFQGLLKAIDETLWAVDPGGAGKDQDLSVLVGRPLAVVRAEVSLRLHGLAATSQDWWTTFAGMSGKARVPVALGAVDGAVTSTTWPVRLGSRALREDGLIGYFADDGYDVLHAVHVPAGVDTAYLSQIGAGGDFLHLRAIDDSVTAPDPAQDQLHRLTMLIDPRGSVHAYSGLLPVATVQLAPASVKPALRQLAYLFRAGPVLTPADAIRMPRPAGYVGTWSWFDHALGAAAPIVPADGKVRLGSTPPLAREGWLKLTPNPDLLPTEET